MVLGLVLMAGAGTYYWVQANSGPPPIHAGVPILVTHAPGAAATVAAHNSPALAVDPENPRHLVLGERIDRPRFGCGIHYSDDGGSTWEASTLTLPAGFDTCYLPDVTFSKSSVFVVFLTLNTHPTDPLSGGNDPNGMWLAASGDGGRTFGPPIDLHGHDNLQPRIVADSHDGRLYIVYVKGSPFQNETPLGLGPPPNPIMVSGSRDGGRTFSAPVQVNDAARQRVGAPTAAIAPNGDLLILYEDFRDDLDDYNNKAIPYRGTSTLVLATSSDQGATFRQSVVDSAQVRPHPFLIYLPAFPALAVAPDGNHIFAAWSDARGGAPDVLLRASSDAGRSWTSPLRLNSRGSDPANYEVPALAAGPGRVDAIFYGLVGTHPVGHVEYAYSKDNARSFSSPSPISARFDATVGVPSARDPGRVDLGSRMVIALMGTSGRSIAAWSDSSRGNRNTGRTDIFATQVWP